jgi:enoyl-CoA hydratase/carnithine racemase
MSTIRLERNSEKIVKIIFENPPVNLIVPDTVARLHEVITDLTNDAKVQVVIFSSNVEDYFYNHFNLSQVSNFPPASSEDSVPVWVKVVLEISKAPFISIASIRGRTRGGGNEFALAMDLRYASREKAFFGQPEVGTGIIPGGGGSERLPRLIGRDRALEAILSSQDYDAETAEKFGWVTRALPDAELDMFVNNLAERFASFDKQAIIAAKAQVNRATLPPDGDLLASYHEFAKSMQWPQVLERLPQFGAVAAKIGVEEMEKNLGFYLGMRGK